MCTGGPGTPPQNSNEGSCDKIEIREKRKKEKIEKKYQIQKNEKLKWIVINKKFYCEVCTDSPHLEFEWRGLWQNQNQGEIGLPKKLPHCCRSRQGIRFFYENKLFTIHWRQMKLMQTLTKEEQTSTATKKIIKMTKVVMVTKLININ